MFNSITFVMYDLINLFNHTTMKNLLLLQELYESAKANNHTGTLNTSKALTLCGVPTKTQNRVLLLTNAYSDIDSVVDTIREIYREDNFLIVGAPAQNF